MSVSPWIEAKELSNCYKSHEEQQNYLGNIEKRRSSTLSYFAEMEIKTTVSGLLPWKLSF